MTKQTIPSDIITQAIKEALTPQGFQEPRIGDAGIHYKIGDKRDSAFQQKAWIVAVTTPQLLGRGASQDTHSPLAYVSS